MTFFLFCVCCITATHEQVFIYVPKPASVELAAKSKRREERPLQEQLRAYEWHAAPLAQKSFAWLTLDSVHDAAARQRVQQLRMIAVTRDGARLLCATDTHVFVYALRVALRTATLANSVVARTHVALLWTQSVEGERGVRAAAFSPDARYLATLPLGGRTVRVWHSPVEPAHAAVVSPASPHDVALLHPAPVRSVSWRAARRPLVQLSQRTAHRNLLLTLADDGIARLWLEVCIFLFFFFLFVCVFFDKKKSIPPILVVV